MAKSVMPVNIRDHGAIGDGQADDTKAIQAAIDTAAEAGQVVYIPAGTYLLSGPVHLTAPTSLVGAGMWHASILRETAEGIVDFDGRVETLTMEGIAFDGAGQVSSLFVVDGSSVRELRVTACRFTNLVQGEHVNPPDFTYAAFELRDVDHAEFVDSLWHNPAKYAGFGMGIVVQPEHGAGRIILTGSNRFLWLNHAMRVLSGDARGEGLDTSTMFVHVDGAYFDEFWWLLPARWSGEGQGVTF